MGPGLSTAFAVGIDTVARLTRPGGFPDARLYERYRLLPIAEKTVLFESYHGARISCNSYAIFKAMLADPRFTGYRFVWTLNDPEPDNRLFAEYRRRQDVEFHARHSPGYLKHLATAKYLVNNKTFHRHFVKRPEQVYIATWHGTTLKMLGKDQAGSMGQYHNVARNILQTDYLVMPNRFTADIMLDSCDVRSLFPGVVTDVGHPRSDLTLKADRTQVQQVLVDLLGIDPSKRTVLYAPTWRGEVGGSRDISRQLLGNIQDLLDGLPEGFQLLLKVHDKTYAFARQYEEFEKLAFVPDWFETNELLCAVDVLVTDYSSIFFDFLCLRRPILHYIFDREEYERTHGLYFDMETEMAGPLCATAAEVNEALSCIDEVAEEYKDRYEHMLERFSYRDDGHASERVLDIVWGSAPAEYVYRTEETGRSRVAAYVGRMHAGVEPLSRALSGLDFDAVDLVLLFDGAPSKKDEYYLTKLEPRIKVIYRAGSSARWEDMCVAAAAKAGSEAAQQVHAAAKAWRSELLGDVGFDVAIDFSGQASAWQRMFAHTPFGRKIAFLAPPSTKSAVSPASLARHFDELVCTSAEAYDFYRERLEGSKAFDKLVLCPVPEHLDEYIKGLEEDVAHLVAGIEYGVTSEARSVDPLCETGDLLFEFQSGGLDPVDLDVYPALREAVALIGEAAAQVEGGGAAQPFAASCEFAALFSAARRSGS